MLEKENVVDPIVEAIDTSVIHVDPARREGAQLFIDSLKIKAEAEEKKKEAKEKEHAAEKQLIMNFASKFNGKIIKLQSQNDDGGTDGIIEVDGDKIDIEARRKGYPNHSGVTTYTFYKGWSTPCLKDGIYLNESTIRNYINKGFTYIVEIKGCIPRFASISPTQVNELLGQPLRMETSTNTKVRQSVKSVPLNWFKEY